MSATDPYAVVVLVGPLDVELERLADLAASVRAWERRPSYWVLIDDGLAGRPLLEVIQRHGPWEGVCLRSPRARTDTRPLPIGGLILNALSHVQARTNARFALKLDTDALVIGPLADAIDALVDSDPEAGVIGTLGDSCNLALRWHAHLKRISYLVTAMKVTSGAARLTGEERATIDLTRLGLNTYDAGELRAFATVRSHVRRAVEHGYKKLEYCQGGAYVVTRAFLDRMAEAGYFDTSSAWNRVPIGEDVLVGMYVRAVGLHLMDCHGAGQPFGVQSRGLPYALDVLAAGNYSVIHSLKADDRYPEPVIRSYFANLRERKQSEASPCVP